MRIGQPAVRQRQQAHQVVHDVRHNRRPQAMLRIAEEAAEHRAHCYRIQAVRDGVSPPHVCGSKHHTGYDDPCLGLKPPPKEDLLCHAGREGEGHDIHEASTPEGRLQGGAEGAVDRSIEGIALPPGQQESQMERHEAESDENAEAYVDRPYA